MQAEDHEDLPEPDRVAGVERDQRGVDQRAGDRHRGELVGPEPLRGGDGQEQRQAVEDRVGGRVQDDVGLRLGVEPLPLDGRAQERLEEAGGRQRPQDRGEDRRDQVNEPVERVALRFLALAHVAAPLDELVELRVHQGRVVADDALVLPAGPHHRDDARELVS
ncbi:hypothetical protein PV517_43795 [Streptomyces griseiscabiei]|uniref:Uncharacterized protein n=1 Tax=Streptomyces griseiscabiei TaxID=2993540 RepID=A0ABU4LJ24_9ACTN|nr:hypothetical protein [Streptomyces griseiscabiei]MBZ3902262.1 hypothetical protein [Streptomyces griseiscabiei]MDX2915583.1 hypothetical protein [Streptomyces griseiscabiei]